MPAKKCSADPREFDALASQAVVIPVVHPPMGGVRPIGAGGSWVSLHLGVRT